MHFCDIVCEADSVNNRNEGCIDRRAFLKAISAAGGAVGLSGVPGVMSLAQAAEAPTAAAIIHGKSARMIVHNGKLGVMETPLDLLREHQSTPVDLIYCRQHFPVDGGGTWMATTEPADHDTVQNWTILVSGLVQRPKTIRVADLEQMDHVKRVSVMQCAGNGRS